MWRPKWLRLTDALTRSQSLVLLLLPCLLVLTLYFLSFNEFDLNKLQYLAFHNNDNATVEETDVVNGYLVWNPKCHMLSKNPLDPSIVRYVKREKFETCSSAPLLTSISRESNGTVYLTINPKVAKHYNGLSCCWAPVIRPIITPKLLLEKEYDSKFSVAQCQEFKDRVFLNKSVETVFVTCKTSKPVKAWKPWKITKASSGLVYENVHAVLNPEKVRERLNASEFRGSNNSTSGSNGPGTEQKRRRDLSVLMLGIDSVSRLNFHRSMPLTREYLEGRGWLELKGYNKMGDNTYPNLMAFLTGYNQTLAYSKCKPKVPYGLDNCSLIWYNFRKAGYVTAYGEDLAAISTFNYLKVGFVNPPTDYYLRPYVIASEKLLKSRQRFGAKYCLGPELSVERIFDFAVEFAKSFVNQPYFGFFWTNGVSHENVNGPSTIDAHFLAKLQNMEAAGVMNDSMIIILSDHGMRYGGIRSTFIGWYEERLPFIYIWLPEWFKKQYPESYHALQINQNRLTSPYDLYETLRDILMRAGGDASASSGCPLCGSLFKPQPRTRGCLDAGVAAHWCTCDAFEPDSTDNMIAIEGAKRFIEHIENIVKRYTNKNGARLCSKPTLKKIIRVNRVHDLNKNVDPNVIELFYFLEVGPGDAKFETTIRYYPSGNYTINDDEVSRINSYGKSAKCLHHGYKQYCHCKS